ncbi:hypothetical protein ACWD6L_03825 [Micromonospora profundi]|uniref:hypothetical protein n=1 Tax=Micromonospora TaxID=1873 RepID=UPI0006AF1B30|nr:MULTISPECIES: hypothetical protein [Micromonospora]KOX03961.1 hypothetical protein ADK66_27165 [Micromonospora sp. NRRL B-16802]NJC10243.1 hypothetical protein [Micromonospora profundi]
MRREPAVRPGCTATRVGRLRRPGRHGPTEWAGRYADAVFATVTGMAENYTDPSGNTEAFRAFTQTPEAAGSTESPSRLPLIIGVAAVVVLLVAVVAWLVA